MPIYSFKYKGDEKAQTHIGPMAQDVEKSHPEAVKNIGGLKHVDFGRMARDEGGVVPSIDSVPMPELYRPEAPPEQNYQPLLDAISSKESPNYYTIHGGKKFDNFEDHPRVYVPIGKGKTSSAAGRYQMIGSTWDAAKKALDLKDFSPKNQDEAAKWIAKQDYQKRTGNSLDTDMAKKAYPEIRRGLTDTWKGLENLSDDDFSKFFEPQEPEFLTGKHAGMSHGGVAGFADGGIPQIVEELPTGIVPSEAVYRNIVKPELKETPHRYVPPGHSISALDNSTLIKRKPEVLVPKLEERVVKERPTIADAKYLEEPALRSADTPTGVKPVKISPINEEKTYTLTAKSPVSDVEGYIRKAAVRRGIDPDIAVRVAKSEGLASGVWQSRVSKNGRRETSYGPFQMLVGDGVHFPKGMGNDFMEKTGLDPSDPSTLQAQIDFALDRATEGGWKPWYGAKKAGVSAWDGISDAAKAVGHTVSDTVEGAKDVSKGVLSGIRDVGDKTGDVISDTTGGIRDFVKKNGSNTDIILSVLSGLGTMASSPSRYLGAAVLQGIGGGAQTYGNLQKQAAEIRSADASTARNSINAVFDAIKPVDGVNMIVTENGGLQKFWDWVKNPSGPAMGGKFANDSLRRIANDAYRTGKDPNTMSFGEIVQTKPVEVSKVEGLPEQPVDAPAVTENKPGLPVDNAVPVSAPEGVAWGDASLEAVKKNAEMLSQQPQMRVPLLENTQKVVQAAQQQAQTSIDAIPAISEQATTITDAIADNNMGSLGNWYADNVVKPYNTLARSMGWEEASANPDADTQRIMLDKLSTLNAQNLKPEDQSSYAALNDFREVSPNMQMTPQAASMITSQQMILNQRNIDRANYFNEVLRQSPSGEGIITAQNDAAFKREMGDIYLKERNDLSKLMQMADKDPRVKRFMHDSASGRFTDPEDVKTILERILGPDTSPVLYRYFYRG